MPVLARDKSYYGRLEVFFSTTGGTDGEKSVVGFMKRKESFLKHQRFKIKEELKKLENKQ